MKELNKKVVAVVVVSTLTLGLAIGSFVSVKHFKADGKSSQSIQKMAPVSEQDKQKLKIHTFEMMGGEYVKKSELTNELLEVKFVKDYKEFKERVDETSITAEEYQWFWEDDDRIRVVLMREPLYFFKEFPTVEKVIMNIPYKGTEHKVVVTRSDIEEFFDIDIAKLEDKKDWELHYMEKVYNGQKRDDYAKKFIAFEKP